MDYGHEETERILREMERKVSKEYQKAVEEVEAKLDDYMRRFAKKDETWRRWVAEGTKTVAEYQQWKIGQIAIGKRWEDLKNSLAQDYRNADKIAYSIINGYMPEVYALNHNYATFEVETGALVDTSYTLYDRQTVERLMGEDPDMLPAPGRNVSQAILDGRATRWNKQQIQSVMMQALLQGEAIPAIATRLARTVGDRDRKAAIRNARTMTTGAENAGRVDGYRRAQGMGIELRQQWVATLDKRTRHSHRVMDGEVVDVGDTFSNGCRFPGDPDGAPREIYNCRCTLIAAIKGFERDLSDLSLRHNEKLEGMSYQEWKESHEVVSNPITLPEEKAEAIRRAYIGEYMRGGSLNRGG